MKKHSLPFRQVHLDFHTSGLIPGIGKKFDKSEWQSILKAGHVNSITLFALCHHGWSYYNSKINAIHPNLDFELLPAQMAACREIGVKTPIYFSAGFNEQVAEQHPEWIQVSPDAKASDVFLGTWFHKLCFNTPYLDYFCEILREGTARFPDANGIFLDIVSQGDCCCKYCCERMRREGLDPENAEDRQKMRWQIQLDYYRRTTDAIHSVNPDMPVFHNSGYFGIECDNIIDYFSHLELESLPTGGWGYDHFPMTAAYVRKLDFDFLGMTGKFHRSWGEFGGFKSPNALKYECAAMIANNAKCSIGDQLHPDGQLDETTYRIIGAAYEDVERKEPWCEKAESAAKIAVLVNGQHYNSPEYTGISRLLLESHLPFDFMDESMDFSDYDTVVVGDDKPIRESSIALLEKFAAEGKRIVAFGKSLFHEDGTPSKLLDAAKFDGEIKSVPSFVQPTAEFAGTFTTPFLMTLPGQKITLNSGTSVGDVFETYFNRGRRMFCSHQHTPFVPEKSGLSAGFINGKMLYFAYPLQTIYFASGAVMHKEFFQNALFRFLGNDAQVITKNLPSDGRVTLMRQAEQNRLILHVLYAPKSLRGSNMEMPGGQFNASKTEVIEDLIPIVNSSYEVAVSGKVKTLRLQPEGTDVPFTQENGKIRFTLPQFTCHAMLEIQL